MDNKIISICSEKGIEIQDIFKFLYQSHLGCEHLVSDYSSALERIHRELKIAEKDDLPDVELLGGDHCRIHLKLLEKGLSSDSLCRLFILSSEKKTDGISSLECELDFLILCAREGRIPFSENEVIEKVNEWRNNGFPAVHHSENYRAAHFPAYRVIKKDYLRILPLLIEIDKLLCSDMQNIIVALDGRSASGKTTMAKWLSEIYDCNVFHTDDFFLRPEQRTKERLSQPGGNVDHERFLSEILLPLSRCERVTYQKYDCTKQSMDSPITVTPKRLNIVEGAYSHHPSLSGYYDLTVFSDVTGSDQKERILKRNPPDAAERFFMEWIPLEEKYFTAFDIRSEANMII